MTGHIIRRTVQGIPLLFLITVIVFTLINIAPGGPEGVYAGDPFISPEDVAQIREIFGLNDPPHVQYLKWVRNLLTGDWGRSYQEKRPVLDMLMQRLPNTLLLSGTAVLIGLLVSVPLAVYTATHRASWLTQVVNFVTLLGISVPTFWTGTIAIMVLAGWLGILPAGGMFTIGKRFDVLDIAAHLLMPALVLASLYIAQWVRYLRASLLDVINEDYVRTARAKGLAERAVLYRHALRNALIPFVTILVLQLPHITSGTIVTEIVFSWPGVGRIINDALLRQDFPVVMGAFTMIAMLVIAASIIGDILYAVIDPRVVYR